MGLNMGAKAYNKMAKSKEPAKPIFVNALKAFLVGGGICLVGQGFTNYFVAQGMTPVQAGKPTAVIMVFLGALLTAFGGYDKLAKWAGMGSALPLTGFSNSMVSAAMEYKREGFVLGVGAKIFSIAGPVLMFGMATAFIVGVIYQLTGYF